MARFSFRRFLFLAALCAGALQFGGCVASEQPLSPGFQADKAFSPRPKPDFRLAGVWREQKTSARADSDDKDVRVLYEKTGFGKMMPALRSGQPVGNDHSQLSFFVTRTPKGDYLNMFDFREEDGSKKDTGDKTIYGFAKYELSADGREARVWLPETKVFAKAVKEGKLKGEAKGASSDVLLQDSSEALLRFIESPDGQNAFKQSQTYRKVD
jgi:hypothetical protein